MNTTKYKACRYPKDKYFALYGVFQELRISFDITPPMYNDQTDAEIMRAVMVACLKHDGNLGALHLCRLAEPYISSYDFIRTRQDSFSGPRIQIRSSWPYNTIRDLGIGLECGSQDFRTSHRPWICRFHCRPLAGTPTEFQSISVLVEKLHYAVDSGFW